MTLERNATTNHGRQNHTRTHTYIKIRINTTTIEYIFMFFIIILHQLNDKIFLLDLWLFLSVVSPPLATVAFLSNTSSIINYEHKKWLCSNNSRVSVTLASRRTVARIVRTPIHIVFVVSTQQHCMVFCFFDGVGVAAAGFCICSILWFKHYELST